ncbi:MAG: hypothetical protein J7M38_05635 [Armatimonadetes bacterium]|nr:hypothetical protein [Armatimonadota bacterium]
MPEHGCYLGAYIRLDTVVNDDMDAFEALVGKAHATYFRYVGWGAPFPFRWVKQLHRRGAMPHIAWEPNGGLDEVRDDDYLRGWAQAAARVGGPIFLRYASEMNGTWQAYSGDPDEYIRKWRLVTRVMREVAPNVVMVWCPFATPQSTITSYYPGDDWVDWVGVNIYSVHHYDGDPSRPALDDPRELLRYVYDLYSARKPIAICEYAATHYCAACRQDVTDFGLKQMTRLYQSLPTEFPRVKMINWFSVDAARNGLAENDYSVTDCRPILERYRELIADPWFLSRVEGGPETVIATLPPSAGDTPSTPTPPPATVPDITSPLELPADDGAGDTDQDAGPPPVTEHPLALAELGPVEPEGIDVAIAGAPPHRVTGVVDIVAEAGRDLPVELMTFYVDGRFQAVTNVLPFRCRWNADRAGAGPHEIRVVAMDRDNNQIAERTVSVIVGEPQ